MADLRGRRVAIANRGEVAIRIATTCRVLGAVPVLLCAAPDLTSAAARAIGRCQVIGPPGAELDVEAVLAASLRANAEFLHPGYGFLSERPELASACAVAGIRFVGPSPETLVLCGDKVATRLAAERARVPVLAASEPLDDAPAHWLRAADRLGYPVFVKPALAGGGRGLRRVGDAEALRVAVEAARSESAASGAAGIIFLEKALNAPRHIEVQLAASQGHVVALGDRDCSLQRRHQKVLEEAPAPNLSHTMRRQLHELACAVGRAVELDGIATAEFLLDSDGRLTFLEVNPRLQVEHPVTEAVTGIDLVAWQLKIAAGAPLPIAATPPVIGHAIEARVCAEDAAADFRPAPGRIELAHWPRERGVRVDAGYFSGDIVPPAYDSLIAKIIAHGADRDDAVQMLRHALRDTLIAGIPTNVPWLLAALAAPEVAAGRTTTVTAPTIVAPGPDPAEYVLAAAAATLERPPAADLWAAIGPFRLNGPAVLTFHGANWEQSVAIDRQDNGWRADTGDGFRDLRWWRDPDGAWTIAGGDDINRFAIYRRADAIEVVSAAGRLELCEGPRPAERSGTGAAVRRDGLIRAPVPGRILRVDGTIGQHVAQGQTLVTMNAMKIDIVLDAPFAGLIATIAAEPGAQIEAGAVLMELTAEPAAEDTTHDSTDEQSEVGDGR